MNVPYLNISEVKKKIVPFAKEIHIFSAREIAKKEFENTIFGNTVLLGTAKGLGVLPLKEKNLVEAIKVTAPREIEKNLGAFERGLKLGKKR